MRGREIGREGERESETERDRKTKKERERVRERERRERERCIINNAHIDKIELNYFQYGSISFITLQFFFE